MARGEDDYGNYFGSYNCSYDTEYWSSEGWRRFNSPSIEDPKKPKKYSAIERLGDGDRKTVF